MEAKKNNFQSMLAPNGQPSNLSPEQYRLVRTPEFKAFFGDWENDPENASKVVDANGEPLVCYHGTDRSFTTFKPGFAEGWGTGIYTTDSREDAESFGSNVYELFVNIRNPITDSVLSTPPDKVYETKAFRKLEKQKMNDITGDYSGYQGYMRITDDELEEFKLENYGSDEGTIEDVRLNPKRFSLLDLSDLRQEEDINAVMDIFRELGYDGILFSGSNNINGYEIVAFKPEQVKLSDGSNTTFDAENPDMRYAKGGSVKLLAPNGQPSNLSPEQYRLVRTPEFKAWFGDWENDPENASKVVDANGEPLVVYHGTDKSFNEFKINEKNPYAFFAENREYAVSFSESEYKNLNKSKIYGCFLNIRQPFRGDKPKFWNGLPANSLAYLVISEAIKDNRNKILDFSEYNYDNLSHFFSIQQNEEHSHLWFIQRNDGMSGKDAKNVFAKWLADKMATKKRSWLKKFYINFGYDGIVQYETLLPDFSSNLAKQSKKYKNNFSKAWAIFYPEQIKLADGTNTTFNPRNPDIRFGDGGVLHTIQLDNLIKNGIVLTDQSKDITIISYNTRNHEIDKPFYNKALIYHSVKPLRQANEIIESFDNGEYLHFDVNKIDEYKNAPHLIVLNQNEVVYDSNNPDMRYAKGGETQTENFKSWFKDSKVVDKKGNPLVVYHGSPDLRLLKQTYIFNNPFNNEQAFFFTDKYAMAKSYADPKRAFDYQGAEEGVIGVYLSLQNPLIVDAGNQIWRRFEIELGGQKIVGTKSLIKYAFDNKYDGVIVKNVRDYYNNNEMKKEGGNVYVAFRSEQIKLADGSNTAFDAENPDIRFDDGGGVSDKIQSKGRIEGKLEGIVKKISRGWGGDTEYIVKGNYRNAKKHWLEIQKYFTEKNISYKADSAPKTESYYIESNTPFWGLSIRLSNHTKPDSYNSRGEYWIIDWSSHEDGYKYVDINILSSEDYEKVMAWLDLYSPHEWVGEWGGETPDEIPVGKLAKGMSLSEVAAIHGLTAQDLASEYAMGIETEMEHTDKVDYARAIALDHLYENPYYYSKLKKIEQSFDEGGEITSLHSGDIITIPNIKLRVKGLSECKNYVICEIVGEEHEGVIEVGVDSIFKNCRIFKR